MSVPVPFINASLRSPETSTKSSKSAFACAISIGFPCSSIPLTFLVLVTDVSPMTKRGCRGINKSPFSNASIKPYSVWNLYFDASSFVTVSVRTDLVVSPSSKLINFKALSL